MATKKKTETSPPLGQAASQKIDQPSREIILQALAESGGREVMFVCLADQGVVFRAWPAARGDFSQVPAPLKLMLSRKVPDLGVKPEDSGPWIDPEIVDFSSRVIIHNHPSGALEPSKADLEVASFLADEGIGSWIIDNQAERVYCITEPAEVSQQESISADRLAGILEPGGELSKLTKEFEPRPSQVDMLRSVVRAFNTNQILLCEAGTGVGKSFAYLIPAMSWAITNQERVVISTATINLQHQLIEKDIPMVQKLLSTKLKAVLAKGRNNYLCVNRFEEVLEEDSLFREEDDVLQAIAQWVEATPNGDRSDLSFPVPDSLWSRINSDADACSGARCRARETCFLLKARREASQASIIVANHHLFFADATMRAQGFGYESTVILPGFSRLIFDEAHTLEHAATSYFSRSLNKFSVNKLLNMLLRRRGGKSMGLIPALRSFLGLELVDAEGLIDQVRTQLFQADQDILAFLADEYSYRLHPELGDALDTPEFRTLATQIFDPLTQLQTAILSLVDHLAQELKTLEDEDLELPQANDVRLIIRRLENTAALCEDFRRFYQEPTTVFWIEKNRLSSTGEVYATITATPLDITPMMRESVFEPYQTVVMASATMTIQGKFDYFERRVGLGGFEPLKGLFSSPFDYKNRVLLGVPTDAPEPSSPGYPEYLINIVSQALEISQGRGLILFTSYSLLNQVFEGVKPRLQALGIPVFRQGDDDKNRLLRNFRDDVSSVLFATDSFWEGVDAPGSSLELLILSRLPFKVPTDPVIKARAEAIDRQGGSSFMQMSVPEAIMKFKQGFGRLMRRSSDRGVVLVTDVRLIQKFYGRQFFDSLPETRRQIGDSQEVLSSVGRFFDQVIGEE